MNLTTQLSNLEKSIYFYLFIDLNFSNWECKSVSEHIKTKFGVLLKVRQCQYQLYELGFSLQHPRYKFPKADPEKQKEFIHLNFHYTKYRRVKLNMVQCLL